tara:strand:- start:205 stop:390 length:186 start_codon:yes stop_codon:yes gene_type:complete
MFIDMLIEYSHHQDTNIEAKKAIQKILREITTDNILSFKLNSLNKNTRYTVFFSRQEKILK